MRYYVRMVEGAPHEYKESSGTCEDCGNSPVNHFEHYVSNSLAVWTADSLAREGSIFALIARWTGSLFDYIEQSLLRGLSAMPFARFSREVAGATTYRSQVIWEEAIRRGIDMEHLMLFGRGTEIYRARLAGKWFYFQSLPIPHDKRSESTGWLDDKYLLKNALSRAGVPVPQVASARSLQESLDAVRQMGSAVIKPRSGSRGRHTSVNVREEVDVRKAYGSARKLCRHVVVEEYLEGPVCRGTVVNGKLVGFFRATPPTVEGDGTSSIRALIENKNAQRHERVRDVILTEEHRHFLARKGLDDDTILPAGDTTPLTHRTGRLFGGATREMLGAEHPKLRGYLERAASVLGVSVVGFDLIIGDPESDPDSQRWGIIEANSLPYIDLHYLALEGAPSNVASSVWDLWPAPMHSQSVDARGVRATMSA